MSSTAETITAAGSNASLTAGDRPGDSTGDCGCGCGGSSSGCGSGGGIGADLRTGLERPAYFARQIVGPDDLNQGHHYTNERLRRHNRFLHGWGIACGLVVTPCADEQGKRSCRVQISAGYALGPYGDEIFVPDPVVVDLCHTDGTGTLNCTPTGDPWCAPIAVAPQDAILYLAVRHVELPVKPVRAPTGCSCNDTSCEHSRIRDWFELTVLDNLPDHYAQPCSEAPDYCASVATCPPCPTSGWVVLAAFTFEGRSTVELMPDSQRRYLLSLAPYCQTCDRRIAKPASPTPATEQTWIAAASEVPDTAATLDLYVDDRPVRFSIAMTEAQLAGATLGELTRRLAGVTVFDAATGRPVVDGEGHPITAAMIVAHGALKPDSVIDDAADLATRFGYPSIEPGRLRAERADVESLLDERGRADFESRALGSVRRLNQIDVEALHGVSKANASKLRAAGIDTLADLRAATRVPSDLSAAAADTVNKFRSLTLDGDR